MAVAEDRRRITFRLGVLQVGAVVLFAVLTMSFWFLQIVQHTKFREMAENNHQRTLALRAPRGILFDRNNVVLVENRNSFSVSIVREHTKDLDRTVRLLSEVAGLDPARVKEIVDRHRRVEPSDEPCRVGGRCGLNGGPQLALGGRLGEGCTRDGDASPEAREHRLRRPRRGEDAVGRNRFEAGEARLRDRGKVRIRRRPGRRAVPGRQRRAGSVRGAGPLRVPVLRPPRRPGRHRRRDPYGQFEIGPKRCQVPVVHADQRHAQRQGTLELLGVVDLDERGHPEPDRQPTQVDDLRISQDPHDQQHCVRSRTACLVHLERVDHEVLPQHRQIDRRANGDQIRQRASEIPLVRQHRDRRRAVRDRLVADGIPARKIHIVHEGVDVDRVAALPSGNVHAVLFLPSGSPVVGTIGALVAQKDHHTLIEAAKLVVREVPDVRFVILG